MPAPKPISASVCPSGWFNLECAPRAILPDFGSIVDIPEEDPEPFITTLNAALLEKGSYQKASRTASVYKTIKPMVFAESMCVIKLKSGI
eukprot:scaffold26903_cov129-Isochrysis_galbana.AAC.2